MDSICKLEINLKRPGIRCMCTTSPELPYDMSTMEKNNGVIDVICTMEITWEKIAISTTQNKRKNLILAVSLSLSHVLIFFHSFYFCRGGFSLLTLTLSLSFSFFLQFYISLSFSLSLSISLLTYFSGSSVPDPRFRRVQGAPDRPGRTLSGSYQPR